MHLILVAYYFQTWFSKQRDIERKAKHAEAGFEISNHECKQRSFTVCWPHMFAADALFICCHKNSQQAIVENFNIHILMLFTYMQMLRTEISNACTKGGSKIHEPD